MIKKAFIRKKLKFTSIYDMINVRKAESQPVKTLCPSNYVKGEIIL